MKLCTLRRYSVFGLRTFTALLFCIAPIAAQPAWVLTQEFTDASFVYDIDAADSMNVVTAGEQLSGVPGGVRQVLGSSDGGLTWSVLGRWQVTESQPQINFYSISHPTPTVIVVGADSGRIVRSDNRGRDWTIVKLGPYASIEGIDVSPSGIGYAYELSGRAATYRTTNSGVSWERTRLPEEFNGLWFYDFSVLYPDTLLLLASGLGDTNRIILRSLDRGGSWSTHVAPDHVSKLTFASGNVGWVAGGRRVKGESYVAAYIAGTSDGGQTWRTQFDSVLAEGFGIDDIEFIDDKEGRASGSVRHIFHTTDGGGSWQHEPVLSPFVAPGFLWLTMPVGSPGVSVSSWSRFYRFTTERSDIVRDEERAHREELYPNPISAGSTVALPLIASNDDIRIWISNALGEARYLNVVDASRGTRATVRIPSDVSSGLYILVAAHGSSTYVSRVVVAP